MSRIYTEKIHVARLGIILYKDNLRELCPASLKYNEGVYQNLPWSNTPCRICLTFVGLKMTYTQYCPCMQLGCEEAVKRTLKAIEKFRLKSQ